MNGELVCVGCPEIWSRGPLQHRHRPHAKDNASLPWSHHGFLLSCSTDYLYSRPSEDSLLALSWTGGDFLWLSVLVLFIDIGSKYSSSKSFHSLSFPPLPNSFPFPNSSLPSPSPIPLPHPTAARIKKSIVRPTATSTSGNGITKKTTLGPSKQVTKFKIRCSRYLYTLVLEDAEKAEKLRQSLPPGEYLGVGGLVVQGVVWDEWIWN